MAIQKEKEEKMELLFPFDRLGGRDQRFYLEEKQN